MTAWTETSLERCVDLVAGFAFKSARFLQGPEGGVPLVKGENVSQGRILWDISRYWPSAEYDDHRRFHLQPGDVVLAMDRPWVPAGLKWAFIRAQDPRSLLVQRCARLRTSTPDLDQGFLRHVIGGPDFEAYIKPITTGVNVPHISGEQILAFRFPLPPLGTQRRIAGILSAYDDLIENCDRRSRMLEQMARALYREWFVLFRYPGVKRQTVPTSLPAGWRRLPIGEIYEALYDGPHATPPPSADGPVFLGIGNLSNRGRLDLATVRRINEVDFERWTKRVLPRQGDIVFTYEATLNRYAIIPKDFRGCLGRRLALIRLDPSKRCGAFLFLHFFSDEWRSVIAENTLSGATVDRIPLTRFPTFTVPFPPNDLLAEFDAIAGTWLSEISVLEQRIENLRMTRDLVAPRLLSGQLSVEDAA